MYHTLLSTPYFASINLLAGREVIPEFCFRGDGPIDSVVEALTLACGDADARRAALEGLDLAAERLGPPGACARAARHVLHLALSPSPT
jgi:lipid A disaccharide synthetase